MVSVINDLKLDDVIRYHGMVNDTAIRCRVSHPNLQGGKWYITAYQAVILADLSEKPRSLSKAEEHIMVGCPLVFYEIESKDGDYIYNITKIAKEADYTLLLLN